MKKQAFYNDYCIIVHDDDSAMVTLKGEKCKPVKPILRQISEEILFDYRKIWNTRYLASQLIDHINNVDKVINDIKDVMSKIAEEIGSSKDMILCDGELDKFLCGKNYIPYIQQRMELNKAFTVYAPYSYPAIKLRLTLLDSLYSTNAKYSYFSIDEMSCEIYKLGTEQDAINYFNAVAQGGKDTRDLFSKNYGIHKNLKDGNKQPSLMSKYAYYELCTIGKSVTNLGFPIYDKLVVDIYPKVCDVLQIVKHNEIKESIEKYVSALNDVRRKIFDDNSLQFGMMQQYDILDAYLWRMGKINKGSFSLLLNKCDYIKFIENIGLKGKAFKKDGFENEVKDKCKTMSVADIMKGINNTTIKAMLEHWKKYYQNK